VVVARVRDSGMAACCKRLPATWTGSPRFQEDTTMFRDREIRRLALARLLSAAGAEGTFFVGIWGRAAFELDATPSQLALVMAVMGVAGLAGSALSGALVDRYGPKRLLVAGEILVVPSTLALMLPSTLAELTPAVALVSFASMVVFNAVASFPPALTSDADRLGRANAALEVAFTGAFVIGPAGAALLSTVIGLEAVFVADAATSLLAVALCSRLPQRIVYAGDERASLGWGEMTAGVRYAYRRPRIRHVFSVGAVMWLSIGFFAALEPLYFRETLHADAATLGWVNSVFGLGMACGALLVDRAPRRFATLPRVTALAAAGGMGAMLYSGTATLAVVIVGALVWGALLGLLSPTVRTLVQVETPDELIGRAMGAMQLHERAGDLTPLAVAPLLASAFGPQAVLVGSGMLVVLIAVALVPIARRLEHGPRADVPAAC
jgi:DHA3 family macrolide efflux protein-like MFS transporter